MHFYKHPNDTLPTQFRVDYHKSIERQGVHKILLGKEMVVPQELWISELIWYSQNAFDNK